jgi:hypothetical protein
MNTKEVYTLRAHSEETKGQGHASTIRVRFADQGDHAEEELGQLGLNSKEADHEAIEVTGPHGPPM